MSILSPDSIIQQVSHALPDACKEHVVVIGSLAVGFHFYHEDLRSTLQTKDVDCVVEPWSVAIGVGKEIYDQLIRSGWTQHHPIGMPPGDEHTPDDMLPAIRMYPPHDRVDAHNNWFLELLTAPPASQPAQRTWTRIHLDDGDYGLPSFQFLPLAIFEPLREQAYGIRYAQPKMMALANLLEHPFLRPDRMSGEIADRRIRRSNKDLGRAIAIASLSGVDDVTTWVVDWQRALIQFDTSAWQTIARTTGAGIRELLASDLDLDEALHTCNHGILTSRTLTIRSFRAAAERLLFDAIEPLEHIASA